MSSRRRDEIILSFHDSVIRRSDLDLLDGSEWLNDRLIGFSLQYLEKTEYKSRAGEIAFVSPEVTHCIKMSSAAEVSVFVEPLNLRKKNFMFFPINDCLQEVSPGGSHWTLLFYTRSANLFYHFDSSSSSNKMHAKMVMDKVVPFVKGRPSPSFVEADTPQQKNTYDCGIHVICTVEYLCKKHLKGERTNIFDFCSYEKIGAKRTSLKTLILSLKHERD